MVLYVCHSPQVCTSFTPYIPTDRPSSWAMAARHGGPQGSGLIIASRPKQARTHQSLRRREGEKNVLLHDCCACRD